MVTQVKIEENKDRQELIRKKELAEKALTLSNNLTVEQRKQLLLIIQDVNSKLEVKEDETKSITGLELLSFFIPIVGLVLYCVFLDSQPQKARGIGKYALAGFVSALILTSMLL